MSAALLGCYDSFKKQALKANAVIPVLFLNTLFSSLVFLPFIILSGSSNVLDGSIFHLACGGWEVHKYVYKFKETLYSYYSGSPSYLFHGSLHNSGRNLFIIGFSHIISD